MGVYPGSKNKEIAFELASTFATTGQPGEAFAEHAKTSSWPHGN